MHTPIMLLSLIISLAHVQGHVVTPLGSFPVNHVAVTSIADSFPGSDGPALLITTFFPFGSDSILVMPNISKVLHGAAPILNPIDVKSKWPNQAEMAPANAVRGRSMVLAADGFFVSPSKGTGAVTLYDVTDYPNVITNQISTDKGGFFYHCAKWLDVDGDGLLDVIAARAFKSSWNPFGGVKGELLWLKQPANMSDPWKETVLAQGPDVAFELVDLDGDGNMEVVSEQFFTAQQLSVWWCPGGWSKCAAGDGVQSAVIDNEDNTPFFNGQWVDLDGDGRKDLLATTNTANGKGAVYAYTYQGYKSGNFTQWTKYKIADGYTPTKAYLPGRGSPGAAQAFLMDKGDKLPHVVVSADDGGFVDLLSPVVPESGPFQFKYAKQRIVNSTDTIGTPAVGDVDGDGKAEVFIPLFAENKLSWFGFF